MRRFWNNGGFLLGSKMMLCTAMLAVLGGGITAFAGEWKTDAKGYWNAKDDGS